MGRIDGEVGEGQSGYRDECVIDSLVIYGRVGLILMAMLRFWVDHSIRG